MFLYKFAKMLATLLTREGRHHRHDRIMKFGERLCGSRVMQIAPRHKKGIGRHNARQEQNQYWEGVHRSTPNRAII